MADSIAFEGWLLKYGSSTLSSSYKDRYFVLRGSKLYYFRARDQNEPNGTISMTSVTEIQLNAEGPNPTVKVKGFAINIITKERTYFLAAKTLEEQRMWGSILNKSHTASARELSTKVETPVEAPTSIQATNISGFLRKRGGMNKAWKDRYFSLENGILHYYKSQEDTEPVGEISLRDVISVTKLEGSSSQTTKSFIGYEFCVATRTRIYYLLAKSKPERLKWMNAIGYVIDMRFSSASLGDLDLLKEGILLKRNPNNTISVWKERYVVLKRTKILYYKSAEEKEALGCIPFHKILKISLPTEELEITPRDNEGCFVIETNARAYIFVANSLDEKRSWINALESALTNYEKTEKRHSRCESFSTWRIEKMSGMLLKRGPSSASAYRERWFVVEENSLKYYKSSLCRPEELAGSIPFADISYVHLSDDTQGLARGNAEGAFMIDTDYRAYYLAARDREEAQQWVSVLERCRSSFAGESEQASSIRFSTASSGAVSSAPSSAREVQSFEQAMEDEDDDVTAVPGVVLEGPGMVLESGDWVSRWIRLSDNSVEVYADRLQTLTKDIRHSFLRSEIVDVAIPEADVIPKLPSQSIQPAEYAFRIMIKTNTAEEWILFQDEIVQSRWLEQLRTIVSAEDEPAQESAHEIAQQRRRTLPQLQGQLSKLREGAFQVYQDRWFAIKGDTLYYYKKKTDANPVGQIPLQEIKYVHASDVSALSSKKDGCPFVIDTIHRTYQLLAPSIVDMTRWIKGLSDYHDFYQSLDSLSKQMADSSA
eukprot:TRINITY_DN2346_c0_g1_i1.p1 TRINITY_DN2346_c0_g1~~TRINITY_DN2346_c0_g1_i1.p1  ORF type:complete len:770 (-),score=176.18 TRINITY_DN2346_c0_g1_i1:1872-4181(-)